MSAEPALQKPSYLGLAGAFWVSKVGHIKFPKIHLSLSNRRVSRLRILDRVAASCERVRALAKPK
jgi:hypothetical protein